VNQDESHGRDRLARNILSNWGAQFLQIIGGFIVPRMIDRTLGQEVLGVWDLAWSIVVYFSLVQMGVTSSINRYVALHHARREFGAINLALSSIAMVMRGMAAGVCIVGLIVAWSCVWFFGERLGSHADEARVVIVLLSLDVAVQISAAVYASVLTGLHRWDLHSGVQSGANVLSVIGMVAALLLGYGLPGLAAAVLLSETAGRLLRVRLAYRLCPWLEIKIRHFSWNTAREMLTFGGKYFLTNASQMILNSGTSILIAGALGPAILATFSRPIALIRSLGVFVNKYAMVFSPTISAYQGVGRTDEISELAMKAVRYGLFALLPAIAVLAIYGDVVITAWMGRSYADLWLVAVLALGFLHQIAYQPLFKTMVGLNRHGIPGVVNLIASVLGLIAVWIALRVLNTGVLGAACAIGTVVMLFSGVFLPVYACRVLKIPSGSFFAIIWATPLVTTLPFAILLGVARWFGADDVRSWVCLTGANVSLLVGLWRKAVPPKWKDRLMRRRPGHRRVEDSAEILIDEVKFRKL
jgi:O-antigen/teichoic acid export membrane protein